MSKIKLFCFPYAGGSAIVYNDWKQYLDPEIELRPIELSGRGRRIHEALYQDLDEAVEDILQQIKNEIIKSPFALFGHSMGSLISYQLAQKIKDNNLPHPQHIFFSGRSAPHVNRQDEKKFHLLSDDDFKKEIIKLGGTSPEFFEHPELLELFLPLLKNDFKIAETEIFNGEEIHPLDVDITVFLGKEDDFTPEQCDGWKNHTAQLCNIFHFNGGHFFLHNKTERVVQIINWVLL